MTNKLSAKFVERVSRPGRYGDGHGGHGLSLLVKPSRTGQGVVKSWAQRLRIHGKPRDMGLGPYPVVTLAEARAAALKNRRMAFQGIDPRTGGIPTFAEAAERVIDLHEPTWRNGSKSAAQWRASLRDYAFPIIGEKRVSEVGPQDIMACLLPNWNDKRETMRRVKQRIQAVMKWSVAEGHRLDDPVAAISAALPKNGVKREGMKALHHSKVGTALATIRASEATPVSKLALEFAVLTASRSGEVRLAEWSEIDLDAAIWTIPADRMKAGREHRVPLTARVIEILKEARAYGDGGFVFPSVTGKPMSDSTLSKLLRENGIKAVPHGFRTSFRTWCADTGKDRDIAEMALAHTVKGVEGAYQRSDMIDRRRELMAAWQSYVDGTI